jgi:hypothetical protein
MTDYPIKFTAVQYKQQYGREQAIEILEKLAELSEKESIALKGKACKYQNAANILKLTSEPEKLGD